MPVPSTLSSHTDFQDTTSSSSRLPSLYSDLSRQRKSNPAGFRSNVQWWREVITSIVRSGEQDISWESQLEGDEKTVTASGSTPSTIKQDRLIFHADEGLRQRWTLTSIGRPLGLGTVIAELKDSSHLIQLTDFLNASKPFAGPATSHSWLTVPSAGTVATFLLGKPLLWAASQFGVGLGSDGEGEEDESAWKRGAGHWVVWDNVEEASRLVLEQYYVKPRLSPLDSLFTIRTFKQELLRTLWTIQGASASEDSTALTDLDIQVLLQHLVRDRRAAVTSKDKKLAQIIKFASAPDAQPLPITEQDRGVAQLRETHASLESQIADIEKRIEQRTIQIKKALKSGQKNQAMSYLRSRKQLEELLDRRTGSRETLNGVLLKIEQAEGDVEIMKAYELSDSTLKQLLSNPLLQHDKVESTVSSLSDALADQAEIDEAVRLGGQNARSAAGEEVIDEEELAKELEGLAMERKADEEEARANEEQRKRREDEERKKQEEVEERRRVEEEKRRTEEAAKKAEEGRKEELERLQGERQRMEERLAALREKAQSEEKQVEPITES